MERSAEKDAIVSGIGQSQVGRNLGRSGLDLTIEAALAAVTDSGLQMHDIDGISAYPGGGIGGPGFSGPEIYEVQDTLGIEAGYHHSGAGGPGQFSAVINAVLAVAAGLATNVLVYRTVTEATAKKRAAGGGGGGGGSASPRGMSKASGPFAWLMPYGAYSAANWLAVYATRYMHEFGLTKEQLGNVPISNRANAALNPDAIFREPLTAEEYMDARMISTPLGLYDCDVPCDGSTAVIVSHAGTAGDLASVPARFEAVGAALRGRPSWDQWDDMTTMCAADAAAQMWTRTDLNPSDVDAAQLYDGFSILTLIWLEALGLCGKGEAGEFTADGRINHDGDFPLNTSGGQLSAGRLHGYGLLHEAVLQLRGNAGERQIAGAEVMAVSAGGGPTCGCLLLTR